MRTLILAALMMTTSAAFGQQFYTKAFLDQDFHSKEWPQIERFGLDEARIVKMGHDRFVAWYCDTARGGPDARIQAEKVYALALNEMNAPLLRALPRTEQKFFEDALITFADFAKSSFVLGEQSTGGGPGWSLPIAASSTAVGEAIHLLLKPTAPVVEAPKADLAAMFAQVSARVKAKDPTKEDAGGRLKFLSDRVDGFFAGRSARDKRIARTFVVKMTQMALSDPR